MSHGVGGGGTQGRGGVSGEVGRTGRGRTGEGDFGPGGLFSNTEGLFGPGGAFSSADRSQQSFSGLQAGTFSNQVAQQQQAVATAAKTATAVAELEQQQQQQLAKDLASFFDNPVNAPEEVFGPSIQQEIDLFSDFENRTPEQVTEDFAKQNLKAAAVPASFRAINEIFSAITGKDFLNDKGFSFGQPSVTDLNDPASLDAANFVRGSVTDLPANQDGSDRQHLINILASNPQIVSALQGSPDTLASLLEGQKTGFRSDISSAFPGDAFGDIDEGIISSIIEERRGPSNQLIANAGARGNFNPTGGAAANQALAGQEEGARERISQVGEGLFSESQQDIDAIRNRALSDVDAFTLGGSFDLAPFSTERQGVIDTRLSTLSGDLETGLGSDPLFDPQSALQAGSRAQGVVSGVPSNQPLLDQIARRESTSINRRGLNTSGSGAF